MTAFKKNALSFGIAFCLSILIFGLFAIIGMSAFNGFGKGEPKTTQSVTTETVPAARPNIPGSNINKTNFTLMLVGNDFRINGRSTSNADSILLVHFSGVNNEVVYIPIPGSTRTYADGTATTLAEFYDKFASRNPQLLAQKITSFTGINIDYYAITNPKGFEYILDELGSFDFKLDKDMKFEDETMTIDLEKGTHRIDGKTAVKILRYLGDDTKENRSARTQLTATFFEKAIDVYINKMTEDVMKGHLKDFKDGGAFNTNITDEDILTHLNTIYGYNESNIVTIKIDEFGKYYEDEEDGIFFDIDKKAELQSRLEKYKN